MDLLRRCTPTRACVVSGRTRSRSTSGPDHGRRGPGAERRRPRAPWPLPARRRRRPQANGSALTGTRPRSLGARLRPDAGQGRGAPRRPGRHRSRDVEARQGSAQWLADHFEDVPLLPLPLLPARPDRRVDLYPAVWSAMLAGRAEGIGSCLRPLPPRPLPREETLAVLGVPPDGGSVMAGWSGLRLYRPVGVGRGARRPAHRSRAVTDGTGRARRSRPAVVANVVIPPVPPSRPPLPPRRRRPGRAVGGSAVGRRPRTATGGGVPSAGGHRPVAASVSHDHGLAFVGP